MTTWNYRVIRRDGNDHSGSVSCYGIHEVYYDDTGGVTMYTKDPMDPFGESVEELRKNLEDMLLAVDKPFLDAKDLPGYENA